MSINVTQRTSGAPRDEEILDVLGFATPSFLLSMLRLTHDQVFLLDEKGHILHANGIALSETCRKDIAMVRGAEFAQFFCASQSEELKRAFEFACTGLHVDCRLKVDGRAMDLSIAPVTLRDGTLECLCALIRDPSANTNAVPHHSN